MVASAVSTFDTYFVAGYFARAISCLVQVFFALNECYLISDKNALSVIINFVQQPEHFSQLAGEILAHPGETVAQLKDNAARLSSLLLQCHQLCGIPVNKYEIIMVPGM